MTKLSHSAVSKFQSCPKSYEYHYLNRLRSATTTGALLFGSAIDVAIGGLLKNEDAESTFLNNWEYADINGVRTYIPTSTHVVYSDSDADKDLLTVEAKQELTTKFPGWEEEISKIQVKKKAIGFKFLKKEEKEVLNLYNWWCLRAKGLLMLKAVRKQILPKIKKVLGTQVYVELKNDVDDTVIGYADLVCEYEGFDKPVVFDFKTSSIDYEEDSVLTSPQLSLYVHALSDKYNNTKNAGYIVLHKRIIKNKIKVCSKCGHNGTGQRHKTCDQVVNKSRCDGAWTETLSPEVRIQVLTAEISDYTQNMIVENIDDINKSIKSGNFIRNLGSCVKPWGKCEFYSKCYQGKDEGLVKKE